VISGAGFYWPPLFRTFVALSLPAPPRRWSKCDSKILLMRKIFTLCCLCLAFCTNNPLKAQNSDDDCPCKRPYICGMMRSYIKKTDSTSLLLRGQTTLHTNCKPIIVIDGDVFEEWKEFRIDTNNVESVEVLKSAAAAAIFGCEGANHGVIIITTKDSKLRKFIIKDFLDGSLIPGATVLFESVKNKNEKFQFVANDSGVVITDKLDRLATYQMTVSAVGHTTLEQRVKNTNSISGKEFLLSRAIVICPEVVITCYDCVRTIRCGYRVTVTRTREVAAAVQKTALFKVFPNPISKGGTLYLELNDHNDKSNMIRVLSLDGKTVLRQALNINDGKTVLQFPTDARWAAGIYFVQLLYENGRVAASEKIILQ
jgi:TonB-dependent SusC/RagA subfamily outer membrane receptor